jgi:hypothetical protein
LKWGRIALLIGIFSPWVVLQPLLLYLRTIKERVIMTVLVTLNYTLNRYGSR